MRFSCDIEDIHVVIETINKGPSSRNPKKLCVYDIHIEASKADLVLNFISSGHHLSKKEKRLEKELPDRVESNELIEHALHHIQLQESEDGPEWKINN